MYNLINSAMSHFTNLLSNFDEDAEYRNLKIRMISEDLKFNINEEYVNSISDKLVFLNDKFSNFVITGSLALNIYGLINRITTDTDLIVKELPKCSTINNTNDYNIDELYIPNTRRLGYIYLNNKTSFLEIINIFKKRRNYTIDMFYDFDNKVKYNTFKHLGKEYKIQDVIQLIDQKRALLKNYANNKSSTVGAHKHNYDLYKIYKNI